MVARLLALLYAGMLSGLAVPTKSGPVKVDPSDQVILDKFLGHSKALADSMTKEHFQGIKVPETICWLDCPRMTTALTAYELTGDADYLRHFATAAENLRSAVVKGPDGFMGWYGLPEASLIDPAKPNAVIAEIQADFRVVQMMSHFIALTDADPKLKEEFAAMRAPWIDLMSNQLVKKWDGSFEDLGSRGAVYRWNKDYQPVKATLTLNHEKISIMIHGLVGLYAITGDDELMRKAVKLGVNLKRDLGLKDGAYVWRTWDPSGPWDLGLTDKTKWRNWIGPEPKAQWHISTTTSALLLYHSGVVFDRTDVDRFVKTQMSVCWNGDIENPLFFMNNGAPAKEVLASPALAPFDAKLAQLLYTGPLQALRLAKADNDWQGGVVTNDYLYGKYFLVPKVKDGKPLHPELGAKFAKKNAKWLKSMTFTVKEPGYTTPAVPPLPTN